MKYVGKYLGGLQLCGDDNHTIGIFSKNRLVLLSERFVVITLIITYTDMYMEVATGIAAFLLALFHFLPISLALMFWYKAEEIVAARVG